MQKKYIAQILLLSGIWGASFLLIRIAGQSFPPLWLAFARSSLGALLLWSILLATGGRVPPRSSLPWLALVALFNNALPFTCFAWGEHVVPSNTAAVLNATTPIFTLLLAVVIGRTRPPWSVLAGIVVGFAGVNLVVWTQSAHVDVHVSEGSFALGVAVIAAGALSYAVGTTIAKIKLPGVEPLSIAASQLALAAAMLLPFAAGSTHPAHLRPGTVMAMVTLGFAGSGLAYLLFFHILSAVSATRTVALTYLLPVWGLLWGAVAHEPIGPLTCVGVLVAIGGLLLINLRPASSTRVPTQAGADLAQADASLSGTPLATLSAAPGGKHGCPCQS